MPGPWPGRRARAGGGGWRRRAAAWAEKNSRSRPRPPSLSPHQQPHQKRTVRGRRPRRWRPGTGSCRHPARKRRAGRRARPGRPLFVVLFAGCRCTKRVFVLCVFTRGYARTRPPGRGTRVRPPAGRKARKQTRRPGVVRALFSPRPVKKKIELCAPPPPHPASYFSIWARRNKNGTSGRASSARTPPFFFPGG
jgi:hypothetical protein